MTTAPKYALEHAHSGENPFDIVDSAWGSIERWRAQAMETGHLGAMSVLSKQLRTNSAAVIDSITEREEALTAREEACDAREKAHAVSVTNFVDFVGKASVLFDRLHKIKTDAEEGPLPLPPGHKSEEPDPSLPDTDELPGQEPGEDAALPGDPSPPAGSEPSLTPREQERAFGESLRLKYPVTRDQTEFPDPELPEPPVVQQPIAAGLDKE